MKTLSLAILAVALTCGTASAQYYVPPPIVPVVQYSYYPPTYVPPTYVAPTYVPPVYYPPTTSYYGPAPTVAYYPPATYGVYGAQTTTYGLGIFRPRQVTTQYYYYPR